MGQLLLATIFSPLLYKGDFVETQSIPYGNATRTRLKTVQAKVVLWIQKQNSNGAN